jgi:hypothetical protein
MEVNGQLHSPAALPPGKYPLVPIGQEDGWTPAWNQEFHKSPSQDSTPGILEYESRF